MKKWFVILLFMNIPSAFSANDPCQNAYFPTISGAMVTYNVTQGLKKQVITRFITRIDPTNFLEKISLSNKTLIENQWSCDSSDLRNNNFAKEIKSHQSMIDLKTIFFGQADLVPEDRWKIDNMQTNSAEYYSNTLLPNKTKAKVSFSIKQQVLSKETIKLKFGQFEALKVQEKITLTTEISFEKPIKQTSQIVNSDWYVKNIGLVKRISKITNITNQKQTPTTISIEATAIEQLI